MTKKNKMQFYPAAITISGSDSSGGAGIAVDLRTFNALGIFGTCAITGAGASNPESIRRMDVLPAESVSAQIDAVLEKIPLKYGKTGRLYSAEIVSAVAKAADKYHLKLVCDPSIIAADGSRIMPDDAVEALEKQLLPKAAWIIPDIQEAQLLCAMQINSVDDMLSAAGKLAEKFSAAIWLKGGQLNGKKSTDVICREGKFFTLTSPAIEVLPGAGHGAGCTLSAAVAGMLTLDFPWKQAVCECKAFVYGSLIQSVELGPRMLAMYPPTEDSSHLIKLEEVGS